MQMCKLAELAQECGVTFFGTAKRGAVLLSARRGDGGECPSLQVEEEGEGVRVTFRVNTPREVTGLAILGTLLTFKESRFFTSEQDPLKWISTLLTCVLR